MAYTTRAAIEVMFGKKNIAKWADLDEDGADETVAARITAAIAYADAEIDSRLRDTMYTLPIATRAGGVPAEIADISNRLAAVWLYETRGVFEFDSETERPLHKLIWHKRDAERKLAEIVGLKRRLDSTLTEAPIPENV